MTIAIRTDMIGPDSFLPLKVSVDLVQIANMDDGYGEAAEVGGNIPVTYARSDTRAAPQQLDIVVNTDYMTPAAGVDIVVLGVDSTFQLSDGRMITAVAGIVLPPGDALNPLVGPIVVIYDTSECDGAGYWVRQDGGGNTSFPRPVLLYHELWHAHEFGDGTLSNPPTEAQVAASEVNAHAAEVDIRDQMGLPRRHPTNRAGGCGGGPVVCCVVASIATGELSDEVNALRRVRDLMLRRSDIGHDLFAHLHHDYYAASPEVCRAMSETPKLSEFVRRYFVGPLVRGLRLLGTYTTKHQDHAGLGRAVREARAELPWIDATSATQMSDALVDPKLAAMTLRPDERRLVDMVVERVGDKPVLQWSLLGPIRLLLDAFVHADQVSSDTALGQRVAEAMRAWSAELPITRVWRSWGPVKREEQLRWLHGILLVDDDARREFAVRVASEGNDHG